MTQLAILEYPDPRLRQTASAVERVDEAVQRLAADLLETMYAAKGVGLAATQVDVHRRVIVIDVSEERDQPLVFINPELLQATGRGPGEEGCLSVPDIFDKVQRATHIRVRAQGLDGRPFEMDAEGLLAVCIQHEMDHLEGKLVVDYLSDLKRQMIRKRLEKERRQRGGAAPTSPLARSAARRDGVPQGAAGSGRGKPGASTPGNLPPAL
jgi:peptide deformylase